MTKKSEKKTKKIVEKRELSLKALRAIVGGARTPMEEKHK